MNSDCSQNQYPFQLGVKITKPSMNLHVNIPSNHRMKPYVTIVFLTKTKTGKVRTGIESLMQPVQKLPKHHQKGIIVVLMPLDGSMELTQPILDLLKMPKFASITRVILVTGVRVSRSAIAAHITSIICLKHLNVHCVIVQNDKL